MAFMMQNFKNLGAREGGTIFVRDPQKTHPCKIYSIDHQDWSRNATQRRGEESKKRKSKIWQTAYLPRPPT